MAGMKPKKIDDCVDCLAVTITRSGSCEKHGLTANPDSETVNITQEAYANYWTADEEKFEVFSATGPKPVATFYAKGGNTMGPNPNADTHRAFDEEPLDVSREWFVVIREGAQDFFPMSINEYLTDSGGLTVYKGTQRAMAYSPVGWHRAFCTDASVNEITAEYTNPHFPLGSQIDEA